MKYKYNTISEHIKLWQRKKYFKRIKSCDYLYKVIKEEMRVKE